MKAYLDCFAGISGNMFLGALLDIGLPFEKLQEVVHNLPISGYELTMNRVQKCGIDATYFDVELHQHNEEHGSEHHHEHHHHEHRHLPDIINIIDNSSLDEEVKTLSKQVFLRLAQAEAHVHGTTIDKVHFHEVGAVDTIVDVVGTVFGLKYLGIDEIYVSKLQVGTGFIKCSHGMMPVPAPATAQLLQGIPYYNGTIARELVTPTGAALIAVLAKEFGNMPENFITDKIGYGAGTWELEIPNTLRIITGQTGAKENNQLMVIETNIDDLNPQFYSHVMDKLFDDGALDVWLTSIMMKKGRPAHKLSVLVPAVIKQQIIDILLTETSTIGVRYYQVDRSVAERKMISVEVPWGQAKLKISTLDGKIVNISPEHDDCKNLASKSGVPLKVVWQAVLEAGLRQIKLR